MRKSQNQGKAKKRAGPHLGAPIRDKNELACMSAPGKNTATEIIVDSRQMTLDVTVEKDAVSRFSSCTAKTSPSTDNNSSGEQQTQESWDSRFQDHIRQQGAALMASYQSGCETPTRVRACSDTTVNALRDDTSSPGRHQKDDLGEINVSTRSSHKTGVDSACKAKHGGDIDTLVASNSLAKASKRRSSKAAGQSRRNQPVPASTSHITSGSTNMNEHTGQRITTPYPGKYKTVMCRAWQQGLQCPFSIDCNYAHGKQELKPRDAATPISKQAATTKPDQKTAGSMRTEQIVAAYSAKSPHLASTKIYAAKSQFHEESKARAAGEDNYTSESADSNEDNTDMSADEGDLAGQFQRRQSTLSPAKNLEPQQLEETKINGKPRQSSITGRGQTSVAAFNLDLSSLACKVKLCDDKLLVGVANLSARTPNENRHLNFSSKYAESETEDSHGHFETSLNRNSMHASQIYSTILAGLQSLQICHTQSESVESSLGLSAACMAPLTLNNLQEIYEEDSGSAAERSSQKLNSVRRLSCFEQICTSSDNSADGEDSSSSSDEFVLRRFASEGMAALSSLMLSSSRKHDTSDIEEVKQASSEVSRSQSDTEPKSQEDDEKIRAGSEPKPTTANFRNRRRQNRKYRKVVQAEDATRV